MIRLTMFPARDGDCLLLEYGDQEATTRILVDGGRADTYADIREPLTAAVGRSGLDLLVVTHVDQDHILGILELLADPERVAVDEIWFNGFGHLDDSPFESFGALDGERLTTALLTQQVNWNRAFHTHAVEVARPHDPIDRGAAITIVSPDRAQLERLIPSWTAECRRHGLIPGQGPEEPPPPGFESFGPINVDELVRRPFSQDTSIPNGTSIAFLFEFEGVRLLFSADAHDRRLVNSIRPLAEAEGGRLRLDALKVSHHGSGRNLSKDLLDLIDCDTYLISTSGDRHNHPDDVAIARILAHGGARKRLVFNYVRGAARWSIPELQERYSYAVVSPPGDDGFHQVEWPRV